ncbi:MAG: MBL fold metallo-hydrolase, partial [Bacilli bacterium]|nr:MBL fold metallo-hydrolase [Bacilli bacterium]
MLVCLSCLLIGVGMSFISFQYEQSSYDALVIEVKENYYIASSRLERLYIYEKGNEKEVGDIIHIEGNKKELSFYRIESDFDFEDYLNKKGIKYQFEVKKEEIIFSNPLRFRAYQDQFLSYFSSDTRGIVGSILFARNEEYDSKDNLDSLHLNRLINASGIYYAMYLSFFSFLFSFFFKKKYARLLGIITLFPYVISLIYKFSLLRFFLFAVFRYLNEYVFKKKIPFLTYFSLIGSSFILLDYHLVYTDSFILGFSIPLLVQLISHSFNLSFRRFKKVFICILILIFFIPFDIKYHHEIYPLAYPMQVLLTPIFVLFGVTSIISSYGLPLYPIIEILAQFIYRVSSLLVKMKFAINVPEMNDIVLIIYYSLYFVSCYYYSIHFKLVYKYLILASSLFTFIYMMPIKNGLTDRVTFINVGQGDACLITHQYTSILIDTGGSLYNDIANDCLIPYFKSERIYDIDLVITTHEDYDHMGALSTLKQNFTVKEWINDASKFPIDIDGIRFVNYNTFYTERSDDNDKSLVIGFRLYNTDFLIMGDAPIEVEKQMIKTYKSIPCDILKVGHHGSDTSTCDEFVKFISPKEAVLSVGRNRYGHPSKKVIDILNKNNVKIRSTMEEGSITYTSYT